MYNNKDLNIKIEKSSINFIRRIAIKSPEANLSINLFDCELTKISDEFFNHLILKIMIKIKSQNKLLLNSLNDYLENSGIALEVSQTIYLRLMLNAMNIT